VPANSYITYRIRFKGGEKAMFQCKGDGDTRVDGFAYDEKGLQVAKATGAGDRFTLTWTPRETGDYRIVLVNFGKVFNKCMLRHN
jgi:hypothetical protein